jgi:hypothetical protein
MSVSLGIWGTETFGNGWFGFAQSGLPTMFTLISEEMFDTLFQETPNIQRILITAKINGINYESYFESLNISIKEGSSQAVCDLTFIGNLSVSRGNAVEIDASYLLPSGVNFTLPLFRGTVQSFKTFKGYLNTSTTIRCHDNVSKVLAQPVTNTEWNGTSDDFVVDEIVNIPDPPPGTGEIKYRVLPFPPEYSYTLPTDYDTSKYQTKQQAIEDVQSGMDVAKTGINPATNTLSIASFSGGFDKTYIKIPITAITSYIEDDPEGFKEAVIQTTTGDVSTTTGNSDSKIVYRTLTPTISAGADATTKAQAVVDESQQKRRIVQIPLNPLFSIHDKINCEDPQRNIFAGRVTNINHLVQWSGQSSPGAWTSLTLRVVE